MRKDLVEKKNDLMKKADEMLNKAKLEKRELTPDEMQELAEIRDDVMKIKKALGLEKDFDDMRELEKKDDATPSSTAEGERACGDDKKRSAEEAAKAAAEERAFEAYIRGKAMNNRDTDVNLTPANNGAVIPTTIANKIIKKVYNICPILEKSSKYNIKGNLDIPFYPASDESLITVAYHDEFEELVSTNGNFSKISLGGFLAGVLSKISRSLINNAAFDIVGFVVDEMAYAIKRFIEKELLLGTVDKVDGLSTLSNSITTAAADKITADEVIDLHDAIKDEYQNGAIWIMSPATRTYLRKLKSSTGYYLLNDDISTPFGTSILGKPVYVSDNMPDYTEDGEVAIYYGDMSGLATKFSEEINIEVLREKFATQHAVGIVGWFEFDSKVENEQKIAKLVMHA
ncbi:MAG: phage major capsid protein [Ruminococcus sp.]|nr:phage major capsid protein [Ruminococcus sp.]